MRVPRGSLERVQFTKQTPARIGFDRFAGVSHRSDSMRTELHPAFFNAHFFCHLVPGDARLLVTERLIREFDLHSHVVIQDVRHILAVHLGELGREGDLELLMNGLVRREAGIADDAALFIGSAAHLITAAELLGNGHVDTAILRYLISF